MVNLVQNQKVKYTATLRGIRNDGGVVKLFLCAEENRSGVFQRYATLNSANTEVTLLDVGIDAEMLKQVAVVAQESNPNVIRYVPLNHITPA